MCRAGTATAPAAHLTAGRAFLYCPEIHQTRCHVSGSIALSVGDGGLVSRRRFVDTQTAGCCVGVAMQTGYWLLDGCAEGSDVERVCICGPQPCRGLPVAARGRRFRQYPPGRNGCERRTGRWPQRRCRSIGSKPQEAHDYAGGLAAYDRHRAIRTRKWRGAFVTRLTVWTTTTFSTPLNPNWRSLTLRIFLRRGTK